MMWLPAARLVVENAAGAEQKAATPPGVRLVLVVVSATKSTRSGRRARARGVGRDRRRERHALADAYPKPGRWLAVVVVPSLATTAVTAAEVLLVANDESPL